jgi:hypothetical protein
MKKTPFVLLVAVLSLSFVGTSMAAGFKVPKSMCLRVKEQGPSSVIVMTTSKGGSVQMGGDEKVSFIPIQGIIDDPSVGPWQMQGSGCLRGDVFHFTFTSSFAVSPYFYNLAGEGRWNFASSTGWADVGVLRMPDNQSNAIYWPLEQVACDAIALPADAPADFPLGDFADQESPTLLLE